MSSLWVLGGLLAACAETYAPALTSFTMRLAVFPGVIETTAQLRVADSMITARSGEVSRCVTLPVDLPVNVHVWRDGVEYIVPSPWSDVWVSVQEQVIVVAKVSGPCSTIAASAP